MSGYGSSGSSGSIHGFFHQSLSYSSFFLQGSVLSLTVVYLINREKPVNNTNISSDITAGGQPLLALNRLNKSKTNQATNALLLDKKQKMLELTEKMKTNRANNMLKKLQEDPELLAKFRDLMNPQPAN